MNTHTTNLTRRDGWGVRCTCGWRLERPQVVGLLKAEAVVFAKAHVEEAARAAHDHSPECVDYTSADGECRETRGWSLTDTIAVAECPRCGSLEGAGHRCIVRLTSSAVATPQRDSSICAHPIGCEHYS